MFQGAVALNLDAKGRLAIPARHRDALAVDNGQVLLTAHPHGCCLVYPVPAWIPIRDKVLARLGPQEIGRASCRERVLRIV